MKSMLRAIGVLLLAVVIFSSCSKSTDPADVDVFAGTFKGKTGYKGRHPLRFPFF
jgi:hypothetical protein